MIPVNKTNKKGKRTIYKKEQISLELEDKMRIFVNMIIDRVIEERKQGIYRS